MKPYLQDADVTIWNGDALTVLRGMEDQSVDCCVTSPPYWGLRDYGHEGQLGLEATPQEYVERLVELFWEVRRVLSNAGTLWLNLGDSYAGSGKGPSNGFSKQCSNVGSLIPGRRVPAQYEHGQAPTKWLSIPVGLKAKDLVGVPWRVAFALQDSGWYLRSDIIWSKPNPMPESVEDRPTKAHEYVFLLAKQNTYHFGQDALREPAAWERWGDQTNGKHEGEDTGAGWIKPRTKNELAAEFDHRRPVGQTWKERKEQGKPGRHGLHPETRPPAVGPVGTRNIRSVWEIPTQPYPDAHFAVFPQELARRCILGGCPAGGTVLDPFGGSGTTAVVARKHDRRSVLIELNPDYCRLASDRLAQQSLLTEAL